MKEYSYLPPKYKNAWYAPPTSSNKSNSSGITAAHSGGSTATYSSGSSSSSSSNNNCMIVNKTKTHNIPNTMPCWYYDKRSLRETPSILEGITLENERRYRKEGARFILDCGTKMGLGINTIATGVVYFHRFYMFHSFRSFPRYVTACCCLFLAGKVEETPKKCRDIIRTARALISDDYFYSFGEDPKEEVMTLERILLQTIKFDLQVEHPHTYLLKYAKCFKGDQQKLQKMVQMAWNFVNDSMSTVVCLQWEPEIIAVALIHLASKLSKFTVVDWIGKQPQHLRWWDMFVGDVTMEILEDICHQVLDLYQPNSKESTETRSPPQKPPSRVDSPTPIRGLPHSSHSISPTPKMKAMPSATMVSGSAMAHDVHSIKSIANPAGTSSDTLGSAIPSTATGAGNYHHLFHAPPPPVNPHHMHHSSIYAGSSTSAVANNSVLPPPPPPHPVGSHAYGSSTSVIAPPIPPPPLTMPPYGGPPPPSNWGPPPPHLSSSHHYGSIPPPLPPNSGLPPQSHSGSSSSSSYYSSSSSSSYARQSRY